MNPVLLIVLVLCGATFTGLGIYALRRKKPMWFYSGTEVKEEEIRDIPAYNRANGILWIAFSLIFWLCIPVSMISSAAAGAVLIGGTVLGGLALPLVYHRIYERYKR